MYPFYSRILSVAVCLSAFLFQSLSAQQTTPKGRPSAYFQQEVNYEIRCALNDEQHTLDAHLKLRYHNNSPDTLTYIYFHLWPNAYKSLRTAYAQQELEGGSTEFYYLPPSQRGGVDNLSFTINGTAARYEIDATHPDICKVWLPQPLLSGQTTFIETPFSLKIPESVSRLGHVGQSYQMTQWYPKPAVYDHKGWHAMPYLDQGEFYSEYGSFDVKITLPSNYVVGATGELQNADEVKFLEDLAATTAARTSFDSSTDFPASAGSTKTLHYIQDNVHDFAWFADKRFHVLKDEAVLPSGKKVAAWAMFTNLEANLWLRGAEYVKEAVEFYSEKVGEYPYSHATAVQSALSAGAGMEYPMITVIGKSGSAMSLERVIVHEVGHNWFYGLLGSNEREHAWMDEGMNSYYEDRYFDEKYNDKENMAGALNMGNLGKILKTPDHLKMRDIHEIGNNIKLYKNEAQAIELHAADYDPTNYGLVVYMKTALIFKTLEKNIGTKKFDAIMHHYYDVWHFGHPYPEDLRAIFENDSKKNLDWFFDEHIKTTEPVDYAFKKVKREAKSIGKDTFDEITLLNKAHHVAAPFSISAVKDGKIVNTLPYDGFHGEMPVLFPSGDYDQYTIDASHTLAESKRSNNHYRLGALFPRLEPLKLKAVGSVGRDDRTQLFWLPLLGFNTHNKTMFGISFYNSLLPNKPLEFTFSPMYAPETKSLTGFANVFYTRLPQQSPVIKYWRVGVQAQSFAYGTYSEGNLGMSPSYTKDIAYYKVKPFVEVALKNKNARSKVSRTFLLEYYYMRSGDANLAPADSGKYRTYPLNYFDEQQVIALSYQHRNARAIRPFGYQVRIEQGKEYVLSHLKADYFINYNKKRGLKLHAYVGGYLQNNTFAAFAGNNAKQGLFRQLDFSGLSRYDYLMDDLYIGRNEWDGLWRNQVSDRTAGFRTATPVGRNDKWVAAIGATSDIPFVALPFLKIFANVGMYPQSTTTSSGEETTENKNIYEAGVSVSLFKEHLQIHVPLIYSQSIQDVYNANDYSFMERITFTLNLRRLDPLHYVRYGLKL